MTRMFLAILTAAMLATASPAQQGDSDPEIETVIRSQLDAFLAGDVETAFTHASPMIKRLFGTPERFGEMVRNGYPMVWRPADVEFLELREIDEDLWQKVLIEDGTGGLHVLDYKMIGTDGGWQIDGVQYLRQPEVGV